MKKHLWKIKQEYCYPHRSGETCVAESIIATEASSIIESIHEQRQHLEQMEKAHGTEYGEIVFIEYIGVINNYGRG